MNYIRDTDSLSWFSGLALFGSLQGFILSMVIFFRRQHPGARFLAGFLVVLAYNELETFNWSSSIGSNFLLFDILPYVFVFALGPCLYFYVRSNTVGNVLSSRMMLLHVVPSLIQLLLHSSIYFYYSSVKDQVERPLISPTVLYNTLVTVSTPLAISTLPSTCSNPGKQRGRLKINRPLRSGGLGFYCSQHRY